jgi:hypothetical protein
MKGSLRISQALFAAVQHLMKDVDSGHVALSKE